MMEFLFFHHDGNSIEMDYTSTISLLINPSWVSDLKSKTF